MRIDVMRKIRNQNPENVRERGNTVIVAMLILISLITLGGLTVLSVQRSMASAGHQRFQSIALYPAESGAAVAMDYMRDNLHPVTRWGAWVTPGNTEPLVAPAGIAGNGALPGDAGNLFSPEMRVWYDVVVVNNPEDPGFVPGEDHDGRVVLRVTGHGPNGTVARVEWDVRAQASSGDPLILMGWRQLF